MATDEQWQVNHTLAECMGTVFETQRWCDIRFRCSDQDSACTDELIQAHKMVLAARSPVFEAMFFGALADSSSEVVLCDVQRDDMRIFIRYMYTDQVDLTEGCVSGVMHMAHKYLVSSLFNVCRRFLTTILRSDNALHILDIAIFYDLLDLHMRVMQHIDLNADKILELDHFLELPQPRLEYVLSSDTFYADEKKIIEVAIKWAERQCREKCIEPTGPNVRDVLGNAFKYLRFPNVSAAEYSQLTYKKGYLSFEEAEDTLRYITGDKSVQTVNSKRIRRPHIGRVKPRHSEENFIGKYVFSQLSEVTSRIKLECKDDLLFAGIVMSSVMKIQKQRLPRGVVPCITPECSLTIVVTLKGPGRADLEIGRCTTSDVQASKTIKSPCQNICLRKSAVVEISLELVCKGVGFTMQIPHVEATPDEAPPPEDATASQRGIVHQVTAIYQDDCRIVDSIVYMSPSKRTI